MGKHIIISRILMQLFILLGFTQFLKPKDDFDFLTGSQQLLLSTKSPKPGVSTFHNFDDDDGDDGESDNDDDDWAMK